MYKTQIISGPYFFVWDCSVITLCVITIKVSSKTAFESCIYILWFVTKKREIVFFVFFFCFFAFLVIRHRLHTLLFLVHINKFNQASSHVDYACRARTCDHAEGIIPWKSSNSKRIFPGFTWSILGNSLVAFPWKIIRHGVTIIWFFVRRCLFCASVW